MKRTLLSTASLVAALVLSSCGEKESAQGHGSGLTAPPDPPSPEVVEALKGQEFGKKLLGNTKVFVGDKYVSADLRKAPEYYLLNFSASW